MRHDTFSMIRVELGNTAQHLIDLGTLTCIKIYIFTCRTTFPPLLVSFNYLSENIGYLVAGVWC